MNIYPFQANYPKIALVASFDSFIKTAKHKYKQYLDSGFYQKHNKDAIFIYEIEFEGQSIQGIICTTSIQDILDGKALKHEDTLATREQETMDHIMQREAIIKPILLAHKHSKSLEKLKKKHLSKKKKLFEFELMNGVVHRYFYIEGGVAIDQFQNVFASEISETFIADGHHRSAASKLLYKKSEKDQSPKYKRILTAYFNIDDLHIWDYNRIINGLQGISATKLIAALSNEFKITYLDAPKPLRQPFEFLMLLQNEWYLLEVKKSILKAWQKVHQPLIHTLILNELILRKIFKVKDIRFDNRMRYVPGPLGIKGVEEKTNKLPTNVGFYMMPVSKADFMAMALKGDVLPPKSTWFEPRLVNGVLNQEL